MWLLIVFTMGVTGPELDVFPMADKKACHARAKITHKVLSDQPDLRQSFITCKKVETT